MPDALRSLPKSALITYLGADVFPYLQRFRVIIDGSHWEDVPIRQSERMQASKPYFLRYCSGLAVITYGLIRNQSKQ